jgi:Na+/H+ antiporter NhaA
VAAVGGMAGPIAVYLAVNFGRPSAPGRGAAMSTDRIFALGVLALAGPGVPERVRTCMLTLSQRPGHRVGGRRRCSWGPGGHGG